MRLLAINVGSSSIRCQVIDDRSAAMPFALRLEGIGSANARLRVGDSSRSLPRVADPVAAVDPVLDELHAHWPDLGELDGSVHRIVHGGHFVEPVVVDTVVLSQLEQLSDLAPLHNPPALRALRGVRQMFPAIPHVAVFDTAYHATLPDFAREYPLPADVRARFGIRRHGFHGISHGDVAARVGALLNRDAGGLRIISCHLGSGASITAIRGGRSVDTSMGMTPLEGLVMGSRAGDIDPGVVLELSRRMGSDELDTLLNRRAGLEGLTGTSDVGEIERRAAAGDVDAALALSIYLHRIRKYIGAYAAALGGVDVIVFTGGVGEHSALVRRRSVETLRFLGAIIDDARNGLARVDATQTALDVSTEESPVRIVVLHADEERAMVAAATPLLTTRGRTNARAHIPIAVSARHAHLSQPTIDRLFGPGYQLRQRTALSQTGQFAAQETVRLIGPRGSLEHVRLMGPPRDRDQVEISRTDEMTLGIEAPLRLSGDLDGTPGVLVEGPEGRTSLRGGVICARRHIHMPPADAQRLGVSDHDVIAIRINSEGRDLVFGDVCVRVSPRFTLEIHLDTDEANAAGVKAGDCAELVDRDIR